MADTNLFEQLKKVLTELDVFLEGEVVSKIRKAIEAIALVFPEITRLIDQLVGLLNQLKTEIEKLDISTIPGLDEISEFTDKVTILLDTAQQLVPTDAVGEVRNVAGLVTSLPALGDTLKNEIVSLIDKVIGKLDTP